MLDEKIRELVVGELDGINVANLAEAETIRTHAKTRNRHRRVTGGIATLLLAFVMIIGAGGLLRQDDSRALFAGIDTIDLQPLSVVHDGEQFVGVTSTELRPLLSPPPSSYVILTSPDGNTWSPVEELGQLEADGIVLAYHDGVLHIVASRRVPADDGATETHELVHRWSANLKDFDELVQPNPALEDQESPNWFVGAVAADAGVAISTLPESSSHTVLLRALDEIGTTFDDVCNFSTSGRSARVRLCGEPETQTLTLDVPVSASLPETTVMLAKPGQAFKVVPELPDDGNGSLSLPIDQLYSTGASIGISGEQTHETNDGDNWSIVDTGQDQGVMMAASGDDRIYRTWHGVAQFGPDDPLRGIAFSEAGGPWQTVDLAAAYDDPDAVSFVAFPDLVASEWGWALVAQQRIVDLAVEPEGVTRQRFSRESDFVLSFEGYELAGHTPFGPATLTDPAGEVIREWNQLEVTKPAWSGFEINGDGVWLPDGNGDLIVTFTHEQWRAIADPLVNHRFAYDVLVSEDGRTWRIVQSSSTPKFLTMGSDRLLLHSFETESYAEQELTIEVVDLAD